MVIQEIFGVKGEKVRSAHPSGIEIHVYPAGHGFNCDERRDYDPQASALAEKRTLEFFSSVGL